MSCVIIYFSIKDTNFRLVTGHSTGRNDVEKSEPDRRGTPTWKTVGYDVSGMPTAEHLLQMALLRAFSKPFDRRGNAVDRFEDNSCKIDGNGDLTITLLQEDLKVR